MKNTFIIVLLIACFATSCKKNESVVNPCQNINSFNVNQVNGSLIFLVDNNGNNTYEISYGLSQIMNNPDNGSKFVNTNSSLTKDLIDIGIYPDLSYTFYIRKVCNTTSKSDWGLPKTIQITNYCNIPKQLKVESNIASWTYQNLNSTATYSQIQYGLAGFALGTGTIANSNSTNFKDAVMLSNNTYDFYVRNFCSNNLGWSNWVGPYPYFCSANYNVCTTPTNVNYTVERNFNGQPVGANFTWASQGLTNFEYVVVAPGSTIGQSQIKAISAGGFPTVLLAKNTNYTFYVRGVCVNTVYTSWTAPLNVNIGN